MKNEEMLLLLLMMMKTKLVYCDRLLRLRLVDRKLPMKLGTCRPVVMLIPPHQTCIRGSHVLPRQQSRLGSWLKQGVSAQLAWC